jgi:ribonuclease BN (tRNA processing enzyme)
MIAPVRVRFLGTGDPVGSGGRGQACIALHDRAGTFLLDCGATAVAAMARFGVDPAAVDMVLVSHLHGDHVAGLPFLLFARWLAARRGRAVGVLTVAGPAATEQRTRTLLEQYDYGPFEELRAAASVEFVVLESGRGAAIGGRSVFAYDAVHFPETAPTALRVQTDGHTIGYSGDTGWTEALVEVADGAELFVCMCHAYGGSWPSHMTFRAVIEQRPRLRCRRLALTHLGPEMIANLAAVRDELAAHPDVILAEDGLALELP